MKRDAKSVDGGTNVAASIWAAFSNWWAVLGVLAGSFAGFSLMKNALDIRLDDLIQEAMRMYDEWVRLPFVALFHWLQFSPPDWLIDFIVLWLLIGGVALRSALPLWRAMNRRPTFIDWRRSGFAWGLWRLLWSRWLLPVWLVYGVVLWPLLVSHLVNRPYIHVETHRVMSSKEAFQADFDLRVVLVTQFIALVFCVLVWATLNSLLSLYG